MRQLKFLDNMKYNIDDATIIKNDSFFQLLLNCLFVLLYECRLWVYLILFSPKTIGIFFHKRDIFKKAFRKRVQISKRLHQVQMEGHV